MSVLTLPGSRLDRSCSWQIATRRASNGFALTRRQADGLHLEVGDLDVGGPAAGQGHGVTRVRLADEGRVLVRCDLAPPALLAAAQGAHLVPEGGRTEEEIRLEQGELLVICSADALEHLPNGLRSVSEHLCAAEHLDVDEVLDQVIAYSPAGAAAVVWWTEQDGKGDMHEPTRRGF